MRRPVYLVAGDAHCAAGSGLAAVVDACLAPVQAPPRERLETQVGPVDLPYFRFVDAQPLMLRLQSVTAGVLASVGTSERAAMGLCVGTSSSQLQLQEQDYLREHAGKGPAVALRHPFVGETAETVARNLGVGGTRLTITTACSAGANALLYAAWMIREGALDQALVLGTEFHNRLSLLGFHSLLLVAPERCRPFDRERAGVVLGEAAAALVLSAQRPARGWEILGGGTLCDVSHPTSPAPQRIAHTLQLALDDAGIEPAAIGAIKAHGTGTGSNDLAEGLGIREVFGDAPPPVTSIKPVFGHTLGACGVLETLAFSGCLERGLIPATGGLREPDPEIGLVPLAAPRPYARAPVLLNYFGFGGNNCSLVLRPC